MKDILQKFNKMHIDYCIIRNYGFLYNMKSMPSEIDVAVSKKDLSRAISALKGFGYKKRQWNFSEKHVMFEKNDFVFDIQIDGIYWNDMPYLDSSIFWFREPSDYFYILCDEHKLVMYICHSILGKRHLKYEKEIKLLLNKNVEWSLVNKYVYAAFGKKYTEEIIESIKNNTFKYKLKYSARFIMNYPFRFIKNSIRWVVWRLTL